MAAPLARRRSPTGWPGATISSPGPGRPTLFHIDLNAQRIGRFDRDFHLGSEGIRDAFYTVMVLEAAGWTAMRHFDAHPYRTEDCDGIWDFDLGCIPKALATARRQDINEPTSPDGLGADALPALRSAAGTYSEDGLAGTGDGHERLDQLVTELLLGSR